jgi:hypothetical protein
MPGDQGKQREVRSDGGRQGTSKEGLAIDDVMRGLVSNVRREDSLVGAVGLVRGQERPVNLEHVRLMANQQEAILGALGSLDLRSVQLAEGTREQADASIRAHEQMIQSIRTNTEHPNHALVQRDFRSAAAMKAKETLGAEGRSAAAMKANETKGPEGRSAAVKKAKETLGPEGRSAAAMKAKETLGPEGLRVAAMKRMETMGDEGLRAAAMKAHETKGPEGRSAATKKANETRGPEGRSAAAMKANETKGPEGRRAATKKANETRRERQQAEHAGREV